MLDEPANGLDPEGQAEMRALYRRLADEGLAVVLSSHLLHEVSAVCNRVAVLKHGRLLAEEDTEALLSRARTSYRIEARDPDAVRGALEAIGLRVRAARDAVLVDLGDRDPAGVLRALVERGAPVESFAPDTPSLEVNRLE